MTMPAMPAMPGAGGSSGDTINWGQLMKESGGAAEPLPNGDYDCKVAKAEAAKTSNGKLMFKLTFEVIAGPHTRRKIWDNQTVSPENPTALGIFFSQMKALGLDANFFGAQPSPDQVAGEMGDLLFSLVNTCRFLDVDAESALDGTTRKFARRFREVERRVREQGRSLKACTLAELDAVWDEVKRAESAG